MPPALKSSRQSRHGATRRGMPPAESRIDRWLNALVSLAVVTALVVGGAALLVTLLF
ncbi:MAG: hypothetical protein HRU39_13485 [Salinicola sp.]|uniref:hypothetical protein n=1 Tax=Salinicola sp. TaxID=1978524 RepID=UPI001D27A057|nr:hypothetical protein [Salinicola sp.]NRB56973.1 hypothetical protein [Salinicola sp.]